MLSPLSQRDAAKIHAHHSSVDDTGTLNGLLSVAYARVLGIDRLQFGPDWAFADDEEEVLAKLPSCVRVLVPPSA
jgi:hypothetical protein